MKTGKNKQENPFGKKGVVGAFCRAYLIREAIEKFLSDVYQPSAQAGRYDYKAGEGSAGLAVYDDVFAYSYHATDPANGKLLNAFDLVRMHRFPDNDPKNKPLLTWRGHANTLYTNWLNYYVYQQTPYDL